MTKSNQKKIINNKAFSLIELSIVILILPLFFLLRLGRVQLLLVAGMVILVKLLFIREP